MDGNLIGYDDYAQEVSRWVDGAIHSLTTANTLRQLYQIKPNLLHVSNGVGANAPAVNAVLKREGEDVLRYVDGGVA